MLYVMVDDEGVLVVPTSKDYVMQAHAISRAAYELPLLQRRLLHLLMAQVQIRNDGIEIVEMSVGDIVRALEMTDNRYNEIRSACRGLTEQVLDIDEPDGWTVHHWVDTAKFIKSRDVVRFRLSIDLVPHILGIKELFRLIPVHDINVLTGVHTYRIFEMIMANRGYAGKANNGAGEWFVDFDFGDLRTLLKIKPTEYRLTADFRKRVIDGPVREINDAGLGIRIECDYDRFRKGRMLKGVRLKCRLLRAGEPRPVGPATKAEHEDDELAAAYPEKYAELLKAEEASPPLPGVDLLFSPEHRAFTKLNAWVKAQTAAEAKPRRGRPSKKQPS